jgi:hypothetical protein
MKFDKSKVCVAGLHSVAVEKEGWFAENLKILCDRVELECFTSIVKGVTSEGFETLGGDLFPFFYPAQEKKYRPFETIEEAQVMKGKWIRSKVHSELFMVTSIRVAVLSGTLLINGYTPESLFNEFVIDETGEPVGVEA